MNRLRAFLQKYYPNEIMFLFIVLVALLSLLLFIQVAGEVEGGELQHIDDKILLMFRDPNDPSKALGSQNFQDMVRDITSLGSATIVTLITVLIFLFLLMKREYRSAVYVLFATVSGAVLVTLLKVLFARERPDIVTHLVYEASKSFPSGHSTISAVMYLSMAVLVMRIEKSHKERLFIICTALFLTFIIGLSRIYLGVHYPSDVLAGWALGVFWALLIWVVSSFFERRKILKNRK